MKRFQFFILVGVAVTIGVFVFGAQQALADWVRPTGYYDGSNAYWYEYRAYDNNTSTYAYTSSTYTNTWTPFLELTHIPIFCNKIQFYQVVGSPYFTEIDIDAYYDGSWHDVYQGSFSTGVWIEKNIPDGKRIVESARIRLYVGSTSYAGRIYEFQFWDVPWAGTWINPTGYVESDWQNEPNAYDDNTGTETIYWIPAGQVLSPWLELTLSTPINSDRIQFNTSMLGPDQGTYVPIRIDIYKNDLWETHYANNWDGWPQVVFYEGTVSRLRARVQKTEAYRPYEWPAMFSEFDFGQAPTVGPCGTCIPIGCGFIASRPEPEQKFAYAMDNNQAGQILLASTVQGKSSALQTENRANTNSWATRLKLIFLRVGLMLASIVEHIKRPFFDLLSILH